MHHPDFDFVQQLLEPILIKDRFAGWAFGGLQFDFYSSSYRLYLTAGEITKQIQIPSEWFDQMKHDDDAFKRRRIKSLLKDSLEPAG